MSKLVCWSCGASLTDIPLPFTRLEQCKSCHADLHVCRLCRYYNPNISDKCDHDMAEPVRDVAVANFCHYFRPRPNAFSVDKKSKSDEGLAQLKSLFGDTDETTPNHTQDKQDGSDSNSAKNRFDAIFKDEK